MSDDEDINALIYKYIPMTVEGSKEFSSFVKKITNEIKNTNFVNVITILAMIKAKHDRNLLSNEYYRYQDFVIDYHFNKMNMPNNEFISWFVKQIRDIPGVTEDMATDITMNTGDKNEKTFDMFQIYVECEKRLYVQTGSISNSPPQLINVINLFLEKYQNDYGMDAYQVACETLDRNNGPTPSGS